MGKSHLDITHLANLLGEDRKALSRYKDYGLTRWRAEKVCLAVGVLPEQIWSTWLTDNLPPSRLSLDELLPQSLFDEYKNRTKIDESAFLRKSATSKDVLAVARVAQRLFNSHLRSTYLSAETRRIGGDKTQAIASEYNIDKYSLITDVKFSAKYLAQIDKHINGSKFAANVAQCIVLRRAFFVAINNTVDGFIENTARHLHLSNEDVIFCLYFAYEYNIPNSIWDKIYDKRLSIKDLELIVQKLNQRRLNKRNNLNTQNKLILV